jgi:hypothetical protein
MLVSSETQRTPAPAHLVCPCTALRGVTETVQVFGMLMELNQKLQASPWLLSRDNCLDAGWDCGIWVFVVDGAVDCSCCGGSCGGGVVLTADIPTEDVECIPNHMFNPKSPHLTFFSQDGLLLSSPAKCRGSRSVWRRGIGRKKGAAHLMRNTRSFSSVLRYSWIVTRRTRQTSHLIRRREDDKSGVFKGNAACSESTPDAHAASANVTADAAPAADATRSDSESSSAVEGAIPFRTCSDAREVQYGVMKGMLLQ